MSATVLCFRPLIYRINFISQKKTKILDKVTQEQYKLKKFCQKEKRFVLNKIFFKVYFLTILYMFLKGTLNIYKK
jgi:Fe2+ transport system protein B